jgi:hypothetical protein
MKKLLTFMLIIVLSAGFLTDCKKKKEDHGTAPDLPPSGSMTMDFSNFTAVSKSAAQKGVETTNWEFASSVATVWEPIVTTTLAVPIAVLKKMDDQTEASAEWIETNTWEWSYNATVSSVVYNARLRGVKGTTDVVWKLYITAGSSAEFLWVEGTSLLTGASGQWTIKESATSNVALLQIDWTAASSAIATVKYTYKKSGQTLAVDSYITLGSATGSYNASFAVYYKLGDAAFSTVAIEWSKTNHNGRVKSTDYLGDSNWYCWDESKVNIECP